MHVARVPGFGFSSANTSLAIQHMHLDEPVEVDDPEVMAFAVMLAVQERAHDDVAQLWLALCQCAGGVDQAFAFLTWQVDMAQPDHLAEHHVLLDGLSPAVASAFSVAGHDVRAQRAVILRAYMACLNEAPRALHQWARAQVCRLFNEDECEDILYELDDPMVHCERAVHMFMAAEVWAAESPAAAVDTQRRAQIALRAEMLDDQMYNEVSGELVAKAHGLRH